MAKNKSSALFAIGTVTLAVADGDEKTTVSFEDGAEIKGVDLDDKEAKWLVDNGAARKGDGDVVSAEPAAEEAAPASDAAP